MRKKEHIETLAQRSHLPLFVEGITDGQWQAVPADGEVDER